MPFIKILSPIVGFEGETQIEWSRNPKPKFHIKPKIKESPPYCEAVNILTEWYTSRGLVPPPEEIEACKDTVDVVAPKQQEEVPTKPAYGTPEFWKDWWRKKKEKEKIIAEKSKLEPSIQ